MSRPVEYSNFSRKYKRWDLLKIQHIEDEDIGWEVHSDDRDRKSRNTVRNIVRFNMIVFGDLHKS